MRIIFSRKGFDSSVGRVPSAILPDGTLISFPIPDPDPTRKRQYAELTPRGVNMGRLLADLLGSQYSQLGAVHLDPDLDATAIPRLPGWRPMFGQALAAEAHLQRLGVGAGDLFLFFGWFKQVEEVGGVYRYVKGAPDLHCLFGWLQVGQRVPVASMEALPTWGREHPHAKSPPYHPQNDAIYVARERLNVDVQGDLGPGGGVFPRIAPGLILTAPGHTRSRWKVPYWFLPSGRTPLSYHSSPKRWIEDGKELHLCTVGRGQEFVLDTSEYPQARAWIADLLRATDVTLISNPAQAPNTSSQGV